MGLIMWSEYAHIIYRLVRMMDGTFLSTASWFAIHLSFPFAHLAFSFTLFPVVFFLSSFSE